MKTPKHGLSNTSFFASVFRLFLVKYTRHEIRKVVILTFFVLICVLVRKQIISSETNPIPQNVRASVKIKKIKTNVRPDKVFIKGTLPTGWQDNKLEFRNVNFSLDKKAQFYLK